MGENGDSHKPEHKVYIQKYAPDDNPKSFALLFSLVLLHLIHYKGFWPNLSPKTTNNLVYSVLSFLHDTS